MVLWAGSAPALSARFFHLVCVCFIELKASLSCSPSLRFKTSKKNGPFDGYFLEPPQAIVWSEQFVGSHFDEVGGV